MRKLLRSFSNLARAWYGRDRVRAAPATGRLLALHVGDQFVYARDAFVVLSREIERNACDCVIIYQLDGSSGPATLLVVHDQIKLIVNATMTAAGVEQPIFDQDVSVIRPSLQ